MKIKILKYLFVVLLLLPNSIVYAATDNGEPALTKIFTTKAFRGSWEVLNKFSWLGIGLQFIISFFCLLGLVLIMYSRLVSMLYLSSRNIWDNVNEIKEANKGAGFGIPSLLKNTFNSNYGGGADAFIGFLYGLLPDVKRHSDFGPGKGYYNLSDTDNINTYMLKTAPMTVMLIFVFTIGFSGTLVRAYGAAVDGLATVADYAVDVNYSRYIDQLVSTGKSYKFTSGSDGSDKGAVLQRIEESAYRKILAQSGITDGDIRQSIGAQVEAKINAFAQDGAFSSKLGIAQADLLDWKTIEYEVVVTQSKTQPTNSIEIPFSDVGITSSDGTDNSAVIYLTRKKAQNTTIFTGVVKE